MIRTTRWRSDLFSLPDRPTVMNARLTILMPTIARGRIKRNLYKTTQNQGKGNGKVNVKAKETKVMKFDLSGSTTEPTKNIKILVLFIKESKSMDHQSKYTVYKMSFFEL